MWNEHCKMHVADELAPAIVTRYFMAIHHFLTATIKEFECAFWSHSAHSSLLAHHAQQQCTIRAQAGIVCKWAIALPVQTEQGLNHFTDDWKQDIALNGCYCLCRSAAAAQKMSVPWQCTQQIWTTDPGYGLAKHGHIQGTGTTIWTLTDQIHGYGQIKFKISEPRILTIHIQDLYNQDMD